MFLSHSLLSRLPALGGLALSTAALLLTAGPALAGREGPVAPPPPPARATPPAPAPKPASWLPPHWDGSLRVTVSAPAPVRATVAAPLTVRLRGPNGIVRSVPVEGGPGAIETRDVIVHPGSTAIIRIATARAK